MKTWITAGPIVLLGALALAGCAHGGEVDETGGITAVRSACPQVAIPAQTGDLTLFDPATSHDASAIDVQASITNLRSTCDEGGDQVQTAVTFDVIASRVRADAPRDVTLPFFLTVVRGGTEVVAKRIGHVAIHFDAGRTRTQASGQAASSINRAAATLPDAVRRKLTEKRKAGDTDAATDPLTRPEVRQAVLTASFEALVGFQLTDAQLKYNATR
ncbi:hypothetical protein [Sphingomonas bacterium]|uniref:hypothetical protein n=1 Tax=Sphingomonas bacterium TaxID=1895847 RepID=UPI0020C61002|nr:hypothetical protein [Sphingomonas bacterium]